MKVGIVDRITLSEQNKVQCKGLVEEALSSAMGPPSEKKGGDGN